jgi:hypothetical protein
MKTGNDAAKTGNGNYPSPFNTIGKTLRLIFFNDRALRAIFLNRKHTFNILFLYGVSLMIPYRDMNGILRPETFGNVVESIVLTFIYIFMLFLYLPKTPGMFLGIMRVVLSFEAMAVILPVTVWLEGDFLKYFHPLFLAWYLSVSVFAVSRIKGYGYFLSAIVVFGSFLVTIFFPAFFVH